MQRFGKLMKIAGAALAVLALAAAAAAAFVLVRFDGLLSARHVVPAHAVQATTSAADLAEGQRLLRARGCADCHGDDLGGRAFLDDPALGRLYAANITPAGRMATYSDEDLERLIRHSVRPDGTSLVFMPADEYRHLGDDELARILQALRAAPPVARAQPPHEPTLLLKALSVAQVFKIAGAAGVDHARAHEAAPPPAVTVAFGAHLAAACVGCHGAQLSGGPIPGAPASFPVPTNLTPAPDGLAQLSDAQFVAVMRTGKRLDGSELDPFMPWKVYRHMTDDELAALVLYLRSLPPRPFGGR